WFESVAETARVHRLPLFAPPSPNLPAVVDALRALAPDVILSVWYRRLLGPDLLALPRVAALNLHGSLLPEYRGRAPVNWVLVNGERRTGVTLHHMTAEADAGDIVAQQAIDIEPEDTALTLYRRIVKVGVDLLIDAYPAVLVGVAPRIPQDHARATVFPRRRPEDGRVQWTWPAGHARDGGPGRILITGGAGFLGSHLAEAWLERGDDVTVLDPASDVKIRHLRANPKFRVIRESVLERDILEGLVAWSDLVYHLAAVVGVEHYVGDPYQVLT